MNIVGNRKVRFSKQDVAAFNAQWSCSTLRATRAYWFEFDERGDLIDTDCPEQDDGPAAAAMSSDAALFLLTGDVPSYVK